MRSWRLFGFTALVGAVMVLPMLYVARLAACNPEAPDRCQDAPLFQRLIVLALVLFVGAIPAMVWLTAPWPDSPGLRAAIVTLLLVVGILAAFLAVGVDQRGCLRELPVSVPGCE